MVTAAQLLETDEALIPTGKILDVEQSAYDLRNGIILAKLLNQGIMLDHCYATGISGENHLKARLKGSFVFYGCLEQHAWITSLQMGYTPISGG